MKLTKRQKEVIELAKTDPVMVIPKGSTFEYCFSNGKSIRRDVIYKLVDAGLLKSNNDGLLPETPQTYSA